MAKDDVRVMPDDKDWKVKTDGKSNAEKFAKKKAKRDRVELFVHNRENKIRKRNSYGYDPESSKG